MGARIYTCPIRIPYADVDRMNVVYYANYLIYFEMARSEMLRQAGMPYGEMERRGVLLPVVEAHCAYVKSARYEDIIQVRAWVETLRGPRLRIAYEVVRDDAGGPERLATGYTDHVCMSPDGRVLRPDADLRRLAELTD